MNIEEAAVHEKLSMEETARSDGIGVASSSGHEETFLGEHEWAQSQNEVAPVAPIRSASCSRSDLLSVFCGSC
ncbi:hypothetical protein GOB34_12960 [Sinorhizobium meliloti]|nr:hypothetical protein [Sinorhizobium meliloti]